MNGTPPLPAVVMINPNFDKNAKEYRCCCGCCHVQRGACIIAIIGLVLKGLSLVGNALSHQWYWAVLAAFGCAMYVMILLAQSKRNPRYYLPYLVLNALYIIVEVVAIVFIALAAIALTTAPQMQQYPYQPYQQPQFQIQVQQGPYGMTPVQTPTNTYNVSSYVLWATAVFATVDVLLSTWFQWIVYHAYKYMKASLIFEPNQA